MWGCLQQLMLLRLNLACRDRQICKLLENIYAGTLLVMQGTHSELTVMAAAYLKRAECGPQRRHELRGLLLRHRCSFLRQAESVGQSWHDCQFTCHAGRSADL